MIQDLVKGDCLEYMAELPDECIDLIVTDPPYLMKYKTGHRKDKGHKFCTTIAGDDDPELICNYIKECYRIMKDGTAMYMFCNSNKVAFFVNELEKYFTIRNTIVWVKNNHSAGDLNHAFGKKHEFIILVNKGESKVRGKRIQDVWNFNKVVGERQLHQNQKPLELIKQCIEKHSDKGDVVFDGFGGSGTTAIAARELNRGFIVIEKDDEYYQAAYSRFNYSDESLLSW